MNRRPNIPMSEQAKQALAEIGGEPLSGSGFEDEAPEPEFRGDNNDADVARPA
jgi:hypothetical protein